MAAKNAYKHGQRSKDWIEERKRLIDLLRAFQESCEEASG